VAGRVAQDAGAFRGGLLVLLGRAEPDRFLFGDIEVFDGEIEVDLI
jgi:hypothetical protein